MVFGVSVASGLLSGSGAYELSSLFGAAVSVPDKGGYVVDFALSVNVAGFNDDLIWNQQTANRPQLRGGRILTAMGNFPTGEMFINRRWNLLPNCRYYDIDDEDTVQGITGTGKNRIVVFTAENNKIPVTRVYYGFEPGVQAQIYVNGVVKGYHNINNLNSYDFLPNFA